VQQAEQLQQQQNPLNVLPAPGTVNVMPGQSDSTPGQLGMPDPNQPDISALVQALQPGGGAMGGVAPQGGEGGTGAPPPAAAGGGALPPDLDQSAQRAARRRGGQGKVPGAGRRPRQAAGVGELWDRWKSRRGEEGDALRGGDVDYERFQTEHGVGQRALQNLKKRNETPDFAPINGTGRGRSPGAGVTVGNRFERNRATNSEYDLYNQGTSPKWDLGDPHPVTGQWFGPEAVKNPDDWDQTTGNWTKKRKARRRRQAKDRVVPGYTSPGAQLLQRTLDKHRGNRPVEAIEAWEDPDQHQDPFDPRLHGASRRDANDDFYTFNDRGMSGDHPGRDRGWKGQFAQEPQGPYDGEHYTKGRATVRGGPGPDVAKYWLNTPHGMHGPHNNVHDAFDAAEPFLAQDAEIGRGQGELFSAPPKKARRQAVRGRHKTAWTGWGPAVFPKTRKVAGWDWDDHLNGYLASKPQHFACECGDSFPTPSGFQRCACGKHWNSYVIGTGGSNREAAAEKFIVREVPVHPNRIVANRKLASFLGHTPDHKIPEYLEHLRGKVQSQDISMGELSDLQGLAGAGYIHPDDMELHEAAGTPEEDFRRGQDRDPDKTQDPFDPRLMGSSKAYRRSVNRRLVDPRTGTIHNLIDPGEVGEGEDPHHPTFRQQPKDWAKRMPAKGNPGQFSKRPIG
jgi:hypothetical protein